MARLSSSEPRVQQSLQDVRAEVQGDEDRREDEDRRLEDWDIVTEYRLAEEASRARPVENGFDQDRSPEQVTDLEPQQRRHGRGCVLDHVQDDPATTKSLGQQRVNEFPTEDVKGGRAHDPGDRSHGYQGKGD